MTSKQEILSKLSEAVLKFEEEDARSSAIEALENNIDAVEAILDGFVVGMKKAGELFKRQEYFVPEILLCADAMEVGMEVLRPHISQNKTSRSKGKIILGTVEGDVHCIGKNLVKLMLDTNGFEVYDLGEDVPVSRFVEEQKRIGADIVALSTLMTTTMMAVKSSIPILKENAPELSIMVGGAPFTDEIAKKFGADGYASDAISAVTEAERIMAAKSS